MPQSAFIVRPFGRKPFTPTQPDAQSDLQDVLAAQTAHPGLGDDRKPLWPDARTNGWLIDFDAIERILLKPALEAARVRGETTGAVVEAGNIREDMFNRLITADLVIADTSLHNPNVFYELGLRQAFRDKFTFMIRCDLSPHPFDLQTDRYFEYNLRELVTNPAQAILRLTTALKKTLNQYKSDSPVFKLMPQLESEDRARFLSVPDDFREEVERARHQRRPEVLELLALECEGHLWEVEGLRWVGRSQFEANFIEGAKETWERICARYPDDVEANTVLSTVYQRQHDRTRSEQALARVTRSRSLSASRHSELRALTGRNLKAAWIADWDTASHSEPPNGQAATAAHEAPAEKPEKPDPEVRRRRRQLAALRSPLLQRAIDAYVDAFMLDLNNSYAGLNALTLQVVQAELIAKHRDVWKAQQRVAADEHREFAERVQRIDQLAHALTLALESDRQRLANRGHGDPWFAMLEAAVMCTTSQQPAYVAQLYAEARYYAPPKSDAGMIEGLRMYEKLGIRGEFDGWGKPSMLGTLGANVEAALALLRSHEKRDAEQRPSHHIIVFVGLRMDDAQVLHAWSDGSPASPARSVNPERMAEGGRLDKVFPPDIETVVQARLKEVLLDEIARLPAGARCIAMAGGASGGDLLFHELCLGIQHRPLATQMFLAIPKPTHIGSYVAPAGGDWVARFNQVHRVIKSPELEAQAAGRTPLRTPSRPADDVFGESELGPCVRVFSDSTELPRWLQDQDAYNVGRRAMLWMLKSAMEMQRAIKAESVTLITLRHAQLTRGEFGGVQYAINLAQKHGADVREIVIQEDGTVHASKPRPRPAPSQDTNNPKAEPPRPRVDLVARLREVDAELERAAAQPSVPVQPPAASEAGSRGRRPGGHGAR